MGKLTVALVGQLCPSQALVDIQRIDCSNKGITEVGCAKSRREACTPRPSGPLSAA